MRAAGGHWSRRIAKPGLTIEELTTDDTDRHGRKEARGQDGFADLAGGCGEQAAKSDFEAKKTVRHVEDWVRRSDENPGKWTNEPKRGQMGSMRNALFKFRLGRESIADRGLTRCSLKMQQRISEKFVSCSWSVVSCGTGGGDLRSCTAGSETWSRGVVSCREEPVDEHGVRLARKWSGVRAGRVRSRRNGSVHVRLHEPVTGKCRPGLRNGERSRKVRSAKTHVEEFCAWSLESQRSGRGRRAVDPRSRFGLVSSFRHRRDLDAA